MSSRLTLSSAHVPQQFRVLESRLLLEW